MKAQDYLNEQINRVKIYTDELSEVGKKFGEAMIDRGFSSEKEAEDIIKSGQLSDDEMDLYFKFGTVSNDYKLERSKLLDFIHFCKILEIELDLSELKDTVGLLEFSKEYLPYKTFHIVTPEKKIKVENKTDYNHKKELFIEQLVKK